MLLFPKISECVLTEESLPPAAELLQDGKMSRAADVYSFAMIMWELFACKRLYEGHIASQVTPSGFNALPAPSASARSCRAARMLRVTVAVKFSDRRGGHAKQ